MKYLKCCTTSIGLLFIENCSRVRCRRLLKIIHLVLLTFIASAKCLPFPVHYLPQFLYLHEEIHPN